MNDRCEAWQAFRWPLHSAFSKRKLSNYRQTSSRIYPQIECKYEGGKLATCQSSKVYRTTIEKVLIQRISRKMSTNWKTSVSPGNCRDMLEIVKLSDTPQSKREKISGLNCILDPLGPLSPVILQLWTFIQTPWPGNLERGKSPMPAYPGQKQWPNKQTAILGKKLNPPIRAQQTSKKGNMSPIVCLLPCFDHCLLSWCLILPRACYQHWPPMSSRCKNKRSSNQNHVFLELKFAQFSRENNSHTQLSLLSKTNNLFSYAFALTDSTIILSQTQCP